MLLSGLFHFDGQNYYILLFSSLGILRENITVNLLRMNCSGLETEWQIDGKLNAVKIHEGSTKNQEKYSTAHDRI
jgi:hypothetical protein